MRILLFTLLFFITANLSVSAQKPASLNFDGDFRLSLNGSGSDASALDNPLLGLRSRIGAAYRINSTHFFRARLAGTITDELDTPRFTILADGGGLDFGSFSFDEFYYRFRTEKSELKIGRFQHSLPVFTNAKRSHIRFQSNNINVHWSDGILWKQQLDEAWHSEVIAEYQPRNHTTYSYQNNLDFNNNEHNFTAYLGVQNDSRDQNNVIQKAVGFFIAPDAYNKSNTYTSYIALSGRLALDFPAEDALRGGSVRLAGELGQNLNTALKNGTIAVISAGVNNFANRHEIMLELAAIDSEWLLANVYSPNANELEIRYRFFASANLNFDFRYRIRDFRSEGNRNQYTTFVRATYSF